MNNYGNYAVNMWSAVRGPVLLIGVGTLFALDHAGKLSIHQSWPIFLVLFGLLKLMERIAAPPSRPMGPPPGPPPGVAMGPPAPPSAAPPFFSNPPSGGQ